MTLIVLTGPLNSNQPTLCETVRKAPIQNTGQRSLKNGADVWINCQSQTKPDLLSDTGS